MTNIDELLEAKKGEYGDAVESMKSFAEQMTFYLKRSGKLKDGEKVDCSDACLIMVLFKVSREAGKRKPDLENIKDGQGYFKIAEKYLTQEAKK